MVSEHHREVCPPPANARVSHATSHQRGCRQCLRFSAGSLRCTRYLRDLQTAGRGSHKACATIVDTTLLPLTPGCRVSGVSIGLAAAHSVCGDFRQWHCCSRGRGPRLRRGGVRRPTPYVLHPRPEYQRWPHPELLHAKDADKGPMACARANLAQPTSTSPLSISASRPNPLCGAALRLAQRFDRFLLPLSSWPSRPRSSRRGGARTKSPSRPAASPSWVAGETNWH